MFNHELTRRHGGWDTRSLACFVSTLVNSDVRRINTDMKRQQTEGLVVLLCSWILAGCLSEKAHRPDELLGPWHSIELHGTVPRSDPLVGGKRISELFDYVELEFKRDGVVLRRAKEPGMPTVGADKSGSYCIESEDVVFMFPDRDKVRAKFKLCGERLQMDFDAYRVVFRRGSTINTNGAVMDRVTTQGK